MTGHPQVHERRFAEPETLARELASELAGELTEAVQQRAVASLVLSGGSTPRLLLEALREEPIPWSSVVITLADERWVPLADPASNEGEIRRRLLVGPASYARLVGLKNEAPSPAEGWADAERTLNEIARPFDAVVLGMGDDGHTASLFPGAAALPAGLDLANPHSCLPVDPPVAPHPRMSLTLAALMDSRRVILHITGEHKWEIYRRALAGAPASELPIAAVLAAAPRQVEVYWAP